MWLCVFALAFGTEGEMAPPAYTFDIAAVRTTLDRSEVPRLRIVPSVVRFSRDDVRLSFLASRHNGESSIAWLEREFDTLRPEVVVIEGVARNLGLNPEVILSRVDEVDYATVRASLSEARVAGKLAHEAGSSFVGAEPSHAETLERLVATTDYTATDLACFLVVRMIPQWTRQGEDVSPEGIDALFGRRIATVGAQLQIPPEELPDGPAIRRWYEQGDGKPLDVTSFPKIGHGTPDHALITKRVGYHVNLIRNQRIGETIAEMVNAHRRVLVVFGGSHYQYMAPALVEMLGEPFEVALPERVIYSTDRRHLSQ